MHHTVYICRLLYKSSILSGFSKNTVKYWMKIDDLFKTLEQDLYRYISSKVDNKEDAKDILQNVFVKVVEKADTLKEEKATKAWIFTICRNTIIDYYRKSRMKVYNNRLDGNGEDSRFIAKEIENAKAVTIELERCMESLIKQLPEKYRYPIIMTQIKGIKQKDLAKEMNIPYPTIRSRVQRGKEKLKDLLQGCCNFESDNYGNLLESKNKNCDC